MGCSSGKSPVVCRKQYNSDKADGIDRMTSVQASTDALLKKACFRTTYCPQATKSPCPIIKHESATPLQIKLMR